MTYCAGDKDMSEGLHSGPCCCASVTGLPGGIHPDSILSASADLHLRSGIAASFNNAVLVAEPGHIVSATAGLVGISRDTTGGNEWSQVELHASATLAAQYSRHPVSVSLYTLPAYLTSDMTMGGFAPSTSFEDGRIYLATAGLSSYQPHWSLPQNLFGLMFDGGLFAEINAPTTDFMVRVVANYVPRAQFAPAYPDQVELLQHYWKCSHGEDKEFLDGFYGGISFDVDSSDAVSGPSSLVRSTSGTNPGSPLDSLNTVLSW